MFSEIKTYNQLTLQNGWQNRTCQKHNIAENFTYDNLNRLRTYTVEQNSNIENFEVNYYNNGNISEKSDVGQYIYNDTDQPHAVKAILPYEMAGGQYQHNPLLDQDIQYNSYNKATKITQGDYELEIFYGHNKERCKTILKQNEFTVYTRYYLGNYEKEITSEGTTEYYYISGPTGNIAVYISENGEAPELYYTITDHLGSIVAIADEDGEILEEQRYDPWGVYRNPATGEPEETPQHTMLYRGYTGHEMLPEFGLINMNGRLYDPVIARVLSPDNNVQNPNNPQNYNRYSYCYNNPLSYVDPDGEFVVTSMIVGAVIFGYMGGMAANDWNINFLEWDTSGKTWAGIGLGVALGATGGYLFATVSPALAGTAFMENFGLSGIAASYTLTGTVVGSTVGYGTGFGSSYIATKSLDYAKLSGNIGATIGSVVGGTAGLLVGRYEINKATLQKLLEDHRADLSQTFSEELVNNTSLKVKGRYNDKMQLNPAICDPYNGHTTGYSSYGYEGTTSTLYFSPKVLRAYRRNEDIRSVGVLYHEFYHANDFYYGWGHFLNEVTGNTIVLELNASEYVYNRFGTQYDVYQFYYNQYLEYLKTLY